MKKYLLLIFTYLFLFNLVSAATGSIIIDTGNFTINALEAAVKLPASVKISEIHDGGSMVVIWIASPTIDEKTNTISLSGITPGGFRGKGTVFSFTGDFTAKDLKKITFQSVNALKNDGKGTPANVRLSTSISESVADTIPPENFSPTISRDENIFDGQYFASFLAQDKGVGVDHYEIGSTWFGEPDKWTITVSPAVINGTLLFKDIYIKAVDRSGNEKTELVWGPYRSKMFVGTAFLVIVGLLFIWRKFK